VSARSAVISNKARASGVRRSTRNGRRPLSGAEEGHARLLSAAAELFRRTGYSASTTRELAGSLGIRSASLYYHIGKKEDLLYEICVDGLERIRTLVLAELAGIDDPLERIRVLVRVHTTTALADMDEHYTMLVEMKSLAARRRRKVTELRDQYEKVVRDVISFGQTSGAIRTDVRAKYLALALLDLLNWPIFWFRPGKQLDAEELGELFASIFIDGALNRPGRPSR
jgi:TetR/AcrR family transcriptional regulator, cholesterol catabolism regulator